MWIGVVFLTSAFTHYTYENRRLTDMLMENDEVISFLPGSKYCIVVVRIDGTYKSETMANVVFL